MAEIGNDEVFCWYFGTFPAISKTKTFIGHYGQIDFKKSFFQMINNTANQVNFLNF